jgi:hypothetical protein
MVRAMPSARQRADKHAFWQQKRCFLCGPHHAQCSVTGQWTRTLKRDTCFLWGPTRVYITRGKNNWESNTSTVTLRVVGGDEKGSLRTETVKYGRNSQCTRTRERLRWQRPAAHTKDRPVLSSEKATHGIKNVTVRRIPYSERKKNLVVSPGWVLYTKTGWPTDRRS